MHPGRRPDFLTDPIQVGSGVVVGSLAGMGEQDDNALDADLRKMAGDITQKHGTQPGSKRAHDDNGNDDEEGEDSDDSTFENLDEPAAPVKKARKAKSPAKSAPTTDRWTALDLDSALQNRYGLDRADMIAYHRNYLSDEDKTTFNLKSHSKYLNLILAQPGIAQDVVFMKEVGHLYFKNCGISTTLYDQGMLTPLPTMPGSQRFPDRGVVAVMYIMVIVAYPNGHNITEDDPDGFGCTCLMGLWGLHTEKALQHCLKTCGDGINKLLVSFCPFCEYWTTNDSALNNQVCKHYGMAMSCYHDGYTTGSVGR